jgi:hypothetical protein
MSTEIISSRDSIASGPQDTTKVSHLLTHKARHQRDPKLLAKEAMTNDNEMHLIKKVFNLSTGDFTNYFEFHIRTNHTAQTSTMTVEWGDGSANSTYTPDSSGNVTISKNYSYSATGLDTYDSTAEIKQAYIKVYPTNDDFDFTHVYNYNISDNARNDHTVNSNFTELRWKSQACTTFRIFGTDNAGDNSYGDSGVRNAPSQNTELEYIEIIKMHDSPGTGAAYLSEEAYNSNVKSIIIHDFKGINIGSSWYSGHRLEEFIVYDDTTTGNKNIFINDFAFRYCYNLKFFHLNSSSSSKVYLYRNAFEACHNMKYIFLNNVLHNTQGYNQFREMWTLEEMNVTFKNGEECRRAEGYGYRNYNLKYINNPMKVSGGNVLDFSGLTSSTSISEFKQMFYDTPSMEDLHLILPNINWTTAGPIDFAQNFYQNRSLKKVTIENPHTNAFQMDFLSYTLYGCPNLEEVNWVGNFELASTTSDLNMSYFMRYSNATYEGLPSWLQTIELPNAARAVNLQYLMSHNPQLYRAPKIKFPDNANGTTTGSIRIDNLNNLFYRSGVKKITSANWDFNNYKQTGSSTYSWSLNQLYNLVEFTGFDFSRFKMQGQNFSMSYAYALEKMSGHTYPAAADMFNINIRNSGLDGDELDTLFTELPDLTGETSRTITITESLGADDCDTTIATGKNYTVTN